MIEENMPNTSLAETIVTNLGGDWYERRGFGLCPGPGHSKGDRSLKIAPHKDNPEDVFVFSFSGDNVLVLKKEWRERGLLPRFGRSEPTEIKSAKAKAALPKSNADDADNAEERREKARWLYDQCRPARGAIVQKYLSWRRIALDPFPGQIGYLPSRPPKYPHPAMLVPFGLPDEPEPGVYRTPRERIQGVLLTYLKPDGGGKANIDPTKRMIGRPSGAPLALIPPNDGLGLLIAEGVETALSGHVLTGLGCWAAGSAGFLPALADAVPAFVECVTVATEDDPAGRRGAEELARRLEARGIETLLIEVRSG
jgi:hypothetical protein